MKRLFISLLIITCLAYALEYSHRIQALGTDFAYLIPDYETDVYRNPQLLDQKIAGISYGPIFQEPIYYYPLNPELILREPLPQMPFKLIFLSKNLGIYGKHQIGHYHDVDPLQHGWVSLTRYAFHFENLWMLKIKDKVLNIFSDVSFERNKYLDAYNYSILYRTSEYLIKTQGSFKIGRFLDLDIKIGMGFFKTLEEMNNFDTKDQFAGIPSCRLALFYRNAPSQNRFTSWFIDLGGPISQREISRLPHSVYLNLHDHESRMHVLYFANTFISNVGWAKGIPIKNESFVAIGVRNKFLYQRAEDVEIAHDLRAITNTISFPVGVECIINRITLRFGTVVSYNFESTKIWQPDLLIDEEISHAIDYNYSFGFGWRPTKWLVIDLYNTSYLSTLRDWAIYVKYLF